MEKLCVALLFLSTLAFAIPSPTERPWVRKIKHTVEADSHDKASLDAFFETTKELLSLHMNCEQTGGLGLIENVSPTACTFNANRWQCGHQGALVCLTFFDSGLSPHKRTEGLIGFATGERWIGNSLPNPEYDFGPLKRRYLEVYKLK